MYGVEKPFPGTVNPYNIVLDATYLYSLGLSLKRVARELEKKGVRRSREAVAGEAGEER